MTLSVQGGTTETLYVSVEASAGGLQLDCAPAAPQTVVIDELELAAHLVDICLLSVTFTLRSKQGCGCRPRL